jgi:hypothetical protein
MPLIPRRTYSCSSILGVFSAYACLSCAADGGGCERRSRRDNPTRDGLRLRPHLKLGVAFLQQGGGSLTRSLRVQCV